MNEGLKARRQRVESAIISDLIRVVGNFIYGKYHCSGMSKNENSVFGLDLEKGVSYFIFLLYFVILYPLPPLALAKTNI